jgi:hypothetical protein
MSEDAFFGLDAQADGGGDSAASSFKGATPLRQPQWDDTGARSRDGARHAAAALKSDGLLIRHAEGAELSAAHARPSSRSSSEASSALSAPVEPPRAAAGVDVGALVQAAGAAAAAATTALKRRHEEQLEYLADAREGARATRASEIASGAVGELYARVLHATGLTLESACLYLSLSLGDGAETSGRGVNALLTAPREQLQIDQQFRMCVHDSLTQRLRLRVLIKELAKDLAELGTAELPLADLRANVPAMRSIVLPIAGSHASATFHMQLTYRLLRKQDEDDA